MQPHGFEMAWDDRHNVDKDAGRALYSSMERCLFSCSNCAQDPPHVRLMTCQGAERAIEGKGELKCLICNPPSGMSQYEGEVLQTLQNEYPQLVFIPQCRPLHGFPGAVDVCVWHERVIIQVDGEQHFKESGFDGLSLAKQQERDERCNELCLQQGWHLLRLHFRDIGLRHAWIRLVLSKAKLSMYCMSIGRPYWKGTLTFSASYFRPYLFRVGGS